MDRVKDRPTYTQVEDNMPADIYLRERMGRCFRCYVIATVDFIYFVEQLLGRTIVSVFGLLLTSFGLGQ